MEVFGLRDAEGQDESTGQTDEQKGGEVFLPIEAWGKVSDGPEGEDTENQESDIERSIGEAEIEEGEKSDLGGDKKERPERDHDGQGRVDTIFPASEEVLHRVCLVVKSVLK